MPFWIAVGAFALMAVLAIWIYWPVGFGYDFNGYSLVNRFVDARPQRHVDEMMREIAVLAADDYEDNAAVLDRLFDRQSLVLVLFGLEIVGLLVNVAWK